MLLLMRYKRDGVSFGEGRFYCTHCTYFYIRTKLQPQQLEQPQTQQLSFEERLALLVDRERTHRENRRLRRLLRSARLKQQACVEEIDYQAKRGLVRSHVTVLITCEWIRSHQNLHITGPTGTGKS